MEVLQLPRPRPLPQALRLWSKAVWKVAFRPLPRELSLSRLLYLPRPRPLPRFVTHVEGPPSALHNVETVVAVYAVAML